MKNDKASIAMHVDPCAKMYVGQLRDIFTLDYTKLIKTLEIALEPLSKGKHIPTNQSKEIDDIISDITALPNTLKEKLSDNTSCGHFTVEEYKDATINYINNKIEKFKNKLKEIEGLTALKEEDLLNAINKLLEPVLDQKSIGLRRQAIAAYNQKWMLNRFNPQTAPTENLQKDYEEKLKHFNQRDSVVAEEVTVKLKLWQAEQIEIYKTAITFLKASGEEKQELIIKEKIKEEAKLEKNKELAQLTVDNSHLKEREQVEDYLIVREGLINSGQAGKYFDYQQLEIYGAYYGHYGYVTNLFQCAKDLYPNNPEKGISELAQIPYNKITDFFNFNLLTAISKKFISFTQCLDLDSELIEIIKQHGIDSPKVFTESPALFNYPELFSMLFNNMINTSSYLSFKTLVIDLLKGTNLQSKPELFNMVLNAAKDYIYPNTFKELMIDLLRDTTLQSKSELFNIVLNVAKDKSSPVSFKPLMIYLFKDKTLQSKPEFFNKILDVVKDEMDNYVFSRLLNDTGIQNNKLLLDSVLSTGRIKLKWDLPYYQNYTISLLQQYTGISYNTASITLKTCCGLIPLACVYTAASICHINNTSVIDHTCNVLYFIKDTAIPIYLDIMGHAAKIAFSTALSLIKNSGVVIYNIAEITYREGGPVLDFITGKVIPFSLNTINHGAVMVLNNIKNPSAFIGNIDIAEINHYVGELISNTTQAVIQRF